MIYTHEVIGNLRESYPIGWMLTAVVTIAMALTWVMRQRIVALPAAGHSKKARDLYLLMALGLPSRALSVP